MAHKDIKQITLSRLSEDIDDKKTIEINRSKTPIEADHLIVIKRDGREELYNVDKMRKVCMWACDGVTFRAEKLLESTRIKLYNKIKIALVYDELIKTAVNSINRMFPQYEEVAAKLLILKFYREAWSIKTNKEYPHMKEVIAKGIKHNRYNKTLFNSYSEAEIDEINSYIDVERDYLFTYKSLYTFFTKYCINYAKNKKLELPQHCYIRIAMVLFSDEDKSVRLQYVKEFYNAISNHMFTVATPIMLNAGTKWQQLSSCVLSKTADNAHSIMDSTKNIAIYSKYKGGTALDITDIRASGSYIMGNNGISSGPVPFLKIVEATIKAFNQGSDRPGVCCIYFPWWHRNVKDLVVLKNNNGTEENRARNLQYSIKLNRLFIQRVLDDKDITLFSPHEVPDLKNKFGKEFDETYLKYEAKTSGIHKNTIRAQDLMALIFKERVETGNIYMFHEENVNEMSMLNRYINSSNLCAEITLPSRASKLIEEKLTLLKNNKYEISKIYDSGEIALCNLASVNLYKFEYLNDVEKQKLISIIIRAMDNTIDLAEYPVQEGFVTNINYRYLGIGVLNFTNYLASKKIVIDDSKALDETAKIFDELSWLIINASADLAIEKGAFPKFSETNWAKGDLPIMRANKKALNLTTYKPDYDKWKILSKKIVATGLRNAQLMAIAPTATSGKAINATESIEPIQHFFYKEDGKISLPTLAPNIAKNGDYYKTAIDCDQYMLIKLAAIRQCYLDQSQSINVYFKKVTSLTDFSMLHFYGFILGVKTFYYCKTEKDDVEEICESCT